jgi:serine/threonine protein phosphatase PrpC
MKFITHTHSGLRPTNQDAFYANGNLFIVCDGVGGNAYGDIASKLACTSLSDYFKNTSFSKEHLDNAFENTQQQFRETVGKYPEMKNMSTTVVMLALDNEKAIIAWMGDSRLYHIRNGEILFVTEDHSLKNELAKKGEDVSHIKRNIITKSLSANHAIEYSLHTIPREEIKAGDFFFLCTDGVLENVTDEFIKSHFQNGYALEKIKALILQECEGKTKDNYTFEIIQIS